MVRGVHFDKYGSVHKMGFLFIDLFFLNNLVAMFIYSNFERIIILYMIVYYLIFRFHGIYQGDWTPF